MFNPPYITQNWKTTANIVKNWFDDVGILNVKFVVLAHWDCHPYQYLMRMELIWVRTLLLLKVNNNENITLSLCTSLSLMFKLVHLILSPFHSFKHYLSIFHCPFSSKTIMVEKTMKLYYYHIIIIIIIRCSMKDIWGFFDRCANGTL